MCMGKGCALGTEGLERGITSITIPIDDHGRIYLLLHEEMETTIWLIHSLTFANSIAVAAFAPGKLGEAWKHMLTQS